MENVDAKPGEYIAQELQGIVGIEIRFHTSQANLNWSQNRDKIDALGVIDGLQQQGNHCLANARAIY